jgi:cyclase
MLRPRIIPCLLVHQGGLVKTVNFRSPKYIGDPINAVKIFNEKEADELVVLDIDASVNGVDPDYQMIGNLAMECRMPLCYGGGIKTVDQAKKIIALGVEKVAISSAAIENPSLIRAIANEIGSQSLVIVLDVRKHETGEDGYNAYTINASKDSGRNVFDLINEMENLGAGELIVNSIDRDGLMAGYDLSLAKALMQRVNIPVTFLGGAGSFADLELLFQVCGVVGASAGSMFVFKGTYKAVLISYPTFSQREEISRKAST